MTAETVTRVKTEAGGHALPDAEYNRRWINRVKARVKINESGCWIWQGFLHKFRNQKPGQPGYAGSAYRGKCVRVHRKMLELKLGLDLPRELHACHSCDNPPCVNPDHLYPATNQQNHLDGGKRQRMQGQRKTHCDAGHEFTPENTYMGKRGLSASRQCKTCQRIRARVRAGWPPDEAYAITASIPQGAVTARRTFKFRRKAA